MSAALIRFPQLKAIVSLSRSTVWRLERDGVFPARRQMSANTVGWIRAEVEDWIAKRAVASAVSDPAQQDASTSPESQ